MSNLHELLPWYANGTLSPPEKAEFEEHLEGCEACTAELALLTQVQDRLQGQGEVLLSDHPSPEHLIAALAEEARDDRSQAVRHHVSLCVTCADEVRRARTEGAALRAALTRDPVPSPVIPRPIAPSRSSSFSWGWALAAGVFLLLIAVVLVSGLQESGSATGIDRLGLVEPTERAGAGSTVHVSPDAATIHLLFPVDVSPAAYPLRVELSDPSGAMVFEDESVAESELYRGAFLFLSLSREDCPDGNYVMRLTTVDGSDSVSEYPFLVETVGGSE